MKKNIRSLIVVAIVAGGIGFFAGMEYKAYQIRTAIENAFKPTQSSTSNQTGSTQPPASNGSASLLDQVKAEGDKIITKHVGDEITLSTIKFTINKVTETQTLSSDYGNPKTAPAGTKFVLLDITITNITKSNFNFDPSSGFIVVDSKKREFNPQTAIGEVTNYIDERSLQPSIPENGILVYQLPSDATNYSFNVLKGGSKELYQVILK